MTYWHWHLGDEYVPSKQIEQLMICLNIEACPILLQGPPGCGKTFLPECIALASNAKFLYYQCHKFTDDTDLIFGVDISAAIAGNAAKVKRPGCLTLAANLSHKEQLVLCIDELDKSSEALDALLLDFLNSGRLPSEPGITIQANMNNLLVFVTSNNQRELNDALLRRLAKVRLPQMEMSLQKNLLRKKGVSEKLAHQIVSLGRQINNQISIAELGNFVKWLPSCHCSQDIKNLAEQWFARNNEQIELLNKNKEKVNTLWGIYKKEKQREKG
jgi:MoxR-like ATPase